MDSGPDPTPSGTDRHRRALRWALRLFVGLAFVGVVMVLGTDPVAAQSPAPLPPAAPAPLAPPPATPVPAPSEVVKQLLAPVTAAVEQLVPATAPVIDLVEAITTPTLDVVDAVVAPITSIPVPSLPVEVPTIPVPVAPVPAPDTAVPVLEVVPPAPEALTAPAVGATDTPATSAQAAPVLPVLLDPAAAMPSPSASDSGVSVAPGPTVPLNGRSGAAVTGSAGCATATSRSLVDPPASAVLADVSPSAPVRSVAISLAAERAGPSPSDLPPVAPD